MTLQSQAINWVFTLNNWIDDDVTRLRALAASDRVHYLVFGREIAPTTGTPHLQGYIQFGRTVRGSVVKRLISSRVQVHVERVVGTTEQASAYCKKDGDYEEFGTLKPSLAGRRSDWADYIEWVQALGRMPSKREIILFSPSLWSRYSSACLEIAEANLPAIDLVGDEVPRPGFQTMLSEKVASDNHDPRKVYFVVDEKGNCGKSWFTRWAMTHHANKTQVLRIAKRDDLAYSIDPTKEVFLFDVPRNQMMYLQYSVLEMLKDRLVYSPKYKSGLKVLTKIPLVIVFSNEDPNRTEMSADRYKVIRIRNI